MAPREAWKLLQRSAQAWSDDGATSMGAALAFYTLFSLTPLLLVAIAIAGAVLGRDQAQTMLLAQVSGLVGERAAGAVGALLVAASTREHGVLPAAIGTLTFMLGATTVFNELKTDIDRIWRCHGRRPKGFGPLLRARLLSIGLVLAIGLLLLASLLASALISGLGEQWFADSVGTVRALEMGVSFLVITGVFAMIYKLLPSTPIAWSDVWVGAGATSALFWIGKFLIGLYLGKAAVASMFGAAGALVMLILWVYYSAQIFFYGAEFTREYAHRHGSKQGETDPAWLAIDAANESDIVERARRVVRGDEPVLLRMRKPAPKHGGG